MRLVWVVSGDTLQHARPGDSRRHHKKSTGITSPKIGRHWRSDHWNGHDEIILEVPEKMANDAATILRETMIETGKAYLARVTVEVDVTIGETWAEK
jgi:hypothetical protein